MGAGLIQANADAHQEAAALADLLGSVAEANSAALQRLALFTTPQRKMVRVVRQSCLYAPTTWSDQNCVKPSLSTLSRSSSPKS